MLRAHKYFSYEHIRVYPLTLNLARLKKSQEEHSKLYCNEKYEKKYDKTSEYNKNPKATIF